MVSQGLAKVPLVATIIGTAIFALTLTCCRHREKLLLAACIAAKQPFVVDATNPTKDDRMHYLTPAKVAKFKVVGVEFQVATGLAISRNSARSGKNLLPERAIPCAVINGGFRDAKKNRFP